MTSQAEFKTRWATMQSEKQTDILDAIRGSGKLTEEQLAAFPDVPELHDMMDCLVGCEEAYDEAVEKCKDSPHPDTCKASARSALTKCCSNC